MTDQRDTPGPLRPEQVQAIRERLAKITPGPWRVAVTAEEAEWWWGDPTPQPEAVVIAPGAEVAVCATNDDGIATYQEIANAEFIAHAPTDLAALLADREQREGEIKRLREALEGLVKWCDKHDWGAVPMTLESRARAALAVAPKEETR